MEEIISNIVAQWGAVGVLVLALMFAIITGYKFITEIMKQHREERKERQKKDDERLRMYQESSAMAVSAIHGLEKTMAEMHTLIQTKLQ